MALAIGGGLCQERGEKEPLGCPATRLSPKSSPLVGGLLHHNALWLRRPNVMSAMANRWSRCGRDRGVASAIVPARDGSSARRGTCRYGSARLCPAALLFRPAEGFAGDQHAVQDDGQLARQGDTGFLVAAPFADAARPILERVDLAHHRKPAAGLLAVLLRVGGMGVVYAPSIGNFFNRRICSRNRTRKAGMVVR